MQEKLLTHKNTIAAVVVVLIILGGCGMIYTSFQVSLSDASSGAVDKGLLAPNVKTFYEIKDTVKFDNLSFIKKPFYAKLKDNTVEIPLVDPVGRPNPFLPLPGFSNN